VRPEARVVVTGGAGFIGSHLVDALLARGCRVTCVDNLIGAGGSTRNVDHLESVAAFTLEREDVGEWAQHSDLTGVDAVFHLAASKNSVSLADPEHDLIVNALGTLRLLRAAARDGVRRFVHSSTGSVVGETDRAHAEDTPTRPVSFYGVSKLAGESYCRVVAGMSGLEYAALRYYHVIGRRQDASKRGGVVPIFARRALAGEPLLIEGDGRQTRSFTSVHDAVAANLIAAEDDGARGAVLHCASAVSVSINELAAFVLEETAGRAGVRHVESRPGDIRRFAVDNGALRRLGLEFDTDWRATVRDVIHSLQPT
jgi:nucleoside-diphosphate-sugar epimerase